MFCLMCVPLLLGATTKPNEQSAEPAGRAMILTIEGSINAGTADYIKYGLEQAAREKVAIVILKLDTPGGFLEATRSIVKDILNAEVPVAVFVAPGGARAGSAGVFITIAGHVAAMSPSTNIGAAHPVTGGGKDPDKDGGKKMAQKIVNDTVAFIKAIAGQRKRNVEWAKKAVLESDSITEKEALGLNVIDLIAYDVRDLLDKIDGKKVTVGQNEVTLKTRGLTLNSLEMSFKQKVVNFFANPQIAYFLMMFGLLGIMMEIYHPGGIFPGVLGAICLFLGFVAMQVLPINYGGLALIILGVLLLLAELLTPTFGLLFVGGIISLTIGSIFLIDSPDPNLRISLKSILPTIVLLSLVLGALLIAVLRSRNRPVMSGEQGMMGKVGVVRTALQPRGTIRIHGEQWNAEAHGDQSIEVGEEVKVVAMEGLLLKVCSVKQPKEQQASE
jgi:membrane-bound serine protease (ClpP class)